MAEKNDQEKALNCESVNDLCRLAEKHIQVYEDFLQGHLTEHTGLLSNCSHPDVALVKLTRLIEILLDLKAHAASHIHVVSPDEVIRANPGRRNRNVRPQPVPVARDSGVESTTSQDLKGMDGLEIASAGQSENFSSATERNLRVQTNANENDQQTEDYTFVDENSQTHPKSSGDPSNDKSRDKDESREKKDDNKKSHDS
ncbi:hypothetical protein BsWGS_06618 [Bradybaena similaris]